MRSIPGIALAILVAVVPHAHSQYEPSGCLNETEAELIQLVNEYRQQNAVDPVPVSATLTEVAQWHVVDHAYATEVTGDYGSDPSCNLHTWYGGPPAAPYGTCCYTADQSQAQCMWDKPAEISGGSYAAIGFEIAAVGATDAAGALALWTNTAPFDDFLLGQGIWAGRTFRALGVGVDEERRRYFLWMAEQPDAAPDPSECSVATSVPDPGITNILTVTAYPNPFNPRTTIAFDLPRGGYVRVSIHDVAGRDLGTVATGRFGAGRHEVVWSAADPQGRPLASGVYFVRVVADGHVRTEKVGLLR